MTKKIILKDKDIIDAYCVYNKSINVIAKEYNVSWNTIKRILNKNNVKIISRRNQKIYQEVNHNLFLKVDSDKSVYWLGFLYADGSIKKDKNEISLVLQESDLQLIKDFKTFVGNNNTIFEKYKKCKDGIHK